MGQRLNIEIIDRNGECLANSYYHWSAFSTSSLATAVEVIANFDKLRKQYENNMLLAIKMLEQSGAGLTKDGSLEKAKELFPNEIFKIGENRNSGLIGITEKDIDETRQWEEGRITINIDTKTIDYGVFFETSSDDEYLQEEAIQKKYGEQADLDDYEEKEINEAVDEYIKGLTDIGNQFSSPFGLNSIPFDELENLYSAISQVANKGDFTIKFNNTIISLVE